MQLKALDSPAHKYFVVVVDTTREPFMFDALCSAGHTHTQCTRTDGPHNISDPDPRYVPPTLHI